MEIRITGRNIELNDDLKSYVHRKMDKLERLYKRIYECEVVLEEEKIRKNVEIILHLKRNRMVSKESSTDIYASIDNASESLKKQLRRLRGRAESQRRKTVFDKVMNPMSFFKLGDDIDNSALRGKIVKSDLFAAKPMLPSEAKMEIELTDKQFLMFKNADTGEANVLYRRNDGNYGIIEPTF